MEAATAISRIAASGGRTGYPRLLARRSIGG
jgi:hypothetical protein